MSDTEDDTTKPVIEYKTDNKIIFFGCWNKDLCNESEPSTNGISRTINSLNNYIKTTEEKPTHLIIAGDNYYPDKNKEKKNKNKKLGGGGGSGTINFTNFRSGFDCLKTIDIPNKHILFGNHDFENVSLKNSIDPPPPPPPEDNIPEDKCPILTTQLNYGNDMKFFDFVKDTLPCFLFNNTLVIFIDTTMYEPDVLDEEKKNKEGKEEEEGEEGEKRKEVIKQIQKSQEALLDCYSKIKKYENETIESIKAIQFKRAEDLLEELKKDDYKFKNIIFMSHHPLLGIKQKYKEEKQKYEIKPVYLEGLKNIELLFMKYYKDTKKYFHLSADVHQLQHSTLIVHDDSDEYKVTQIIAGTGGAELDPEVTVPDFLQGTNFKDSNIDYKIHKSLSTFGFLECFMGEKLHFTFHNTNCPKIEIDPEPKTHGSASASAAAVVGGGRRRKTNKKRKTNKRRQRRHSRRLRRRF